MLNMEPIVHKLKRLIREKNISHASIAEDLGKHRTFITRKLGGDSMETKLLEDIMGVVGLTYEDLVCNQQGGDLQRQIEELRQEVNMIKEYIPEYKKRNDS